VSPLLSMLLSVSGALSEAELSAMKFLCRDRVPKRRLEAVRSGAELFAILQEQQHIGVHNLAFLRALLQHIRRADLLEQLRRFEEQGQPGAAPGDEPDEQEQPTSVICDEIGKEWKKLMRELGMSEVKLDRIEAAHGSNLYERVFQGLREWQKSKGKDAKVADLIKALRGCRLNLVADLVEE
ncbi:FADD protein, partial [Xiphorhynchus elegans]|nr:FADD protein [Campylorhamphus procurvoides]NXU89815.1 FADD protein [Xiphorhynchus elegans]